jgi:hypothetical protein
MGTTEDACGLLPFGSGAEDNRCMPRVTRLAPPQNKWNAHTGR